MARSAIPELTQKESELPGSLHYSLPRPYPQRMTTMAMDLEFVSWAAHLLRTDVSPSCNCGKHCPSIYVESVWSRSTGDDGHSRLEADTRATLPNPHSFTAPCPVELNKSSTCWNGGWQWEMLAPCSWTSQLPWHESNEALSVIN